MRNRSFFALWLSALAFSACDQATSAGALRNLDRPTEIAFACFGDLNVAGTGTVSSAQPLSSCVAHLAGTPPEGQEAVTAPILFGFVLQPAEGTVAVINVPAQGIQDNDLFTPGLNDIPVGSLPVGMAEDYSGCFVVTANSGSCDIASIDATSALDLNSIAQVNRFPITTPSGDSLLARPRSIATGPQMQEVGNACPEEAQGLVYITYPDCNLVAAVEASSGEVQSGLVFRESGVVEVAVDADYAACPVQCGGESIAVAHGTEPELLEEKPVAVEISPDGLSLYVTSETSPFFTIVELDEDGLPTINLRRIRVAPNSDGDEVGLRNFAVSDPIEMGGNIYPPILQPIGEFQFVYAIATDSTIRVIDIEHDQECDTQVDPRFLTSEEDVEFLSCMPVGDVRTPPRRFGAKGPGIELPGRLNRGRTGTSSLALPLDIAFSTSPAPEIGLAELAPIPDQLAGSFAFVTAATGRVFLINVDDDAYGDTYNPENREVILPLALPHQLRDNIAARESESANCVIGTGQAGARINGAPSQFIDLDNIAGGKVHELPFFRGLRCDSTSTAENPTSSLVTELSFPADLATRASSFPDIRAVESQTWTVAWEGAHSADSIDDAIDGPIIRKGIAARDGGRFVLRDAGSPFCGLGVEPYDIVAMRGCNPLLDDLQCGVGESCYVHPDTTSAVQSGVCLASERADDLSGTCREFLTSRRRYSVSESKSDELTLVERRRVLRTTPLDGCESATQCGELALLEPLLALEDHPIEAVLPEPERVFDWVCEEDPSRVPGIDRCLMACEAASDCEDGFTCAGQRCVEGALPPVECIGAVQRYQTLVGDAFAVRGSQDGFITDLIRDPGTGECVHPAEANPLAVARLPLRPEPCDDDEDFMTGPNPCSTTVSHDEDFIPFVVEDGFCIEQTVAPRTREAPAVRFSNPGLQFHLVDTETRGDLDCRADKAGEGPAFGTPFPGYQFIFQIIDGFSPKTVVAETALPIRIVPGPSGNLWILDQGEVSSFNRGRVIRMNPLNPGAGFEQQVFE